MANGKLNGYFKWIVLLLPLILGAAAGFMRHEAKLKSLETKVDVQYQAILRELTDIKDMVR